MKAPSKRLIYEVEDLDEAVRELKGRGWKPEGGSFEIPDGPCINFKDESGNEYAILQMSRPHILEEEFQKGRRKGIVGLSADALVGGAHETRHVALRGGSEEVVARWTWM